LAALALRRSPRFSETTPNSWKSKDRRKALGEIWCLLSFLSVRMAAC
jgi:hypothetical protein